MDTVEKALEKATRDLNSPEEQREAIFSRTKLLEKQRSEVAFAAHTGDAKAKARLKDINSEAALHGQDIASVDAALTVARANLAAAKQSEAKAADHEEALALLAKAARLKELGEGLDDCFVDFKGMAIETKEVLDDIHQLGCAAPSHQQLRVFGEICLKTAVMGTPFWTQDFPFIGPLERKSFASVVSAWAATVTANAEARLGDTKDKKDAA
jgi:hypothetical protein